MTIYGIGRHLELMEILPLTLSLSKGRPCMVRQAHHERAPGLTVVGLPGLTMSGLQGTP